MTKPTLARLREAYKLGASHKEACEYAGITPPTIYTYIRENPEFKDEIESLQTRPTLKARRKVVTEIENDANLALKYLEKKKRDEFGSIHEIHVSGEISHTFDPDAIERLENLRKELNDGLKQQYIEAETIEEGDTTALSDGHKPVPGTSRNQE